jgi:hypothetical protein
VPCRESGIRFFREYPKLVLISSCGHPYTSDSVTDMCESERTHKRTHERIMVHVGFTGFENRHVTRLIPFCFPENSSGIAMFYMSMEKFVLQSCHRSVFDRKN